MKVAGDRSARQWPLNYVSEQFARLCEDAAVAKVEITIELSPTSNLAQLRTGCVVVDDAGRANGNLLLDIWSAVRAAIDLEEFAILRPGIVKYAELSDGQLGLRGDYLIETTTLRLLPGEGNYPLRPFIAALERRGYRGPFGVEMLSHKFRQLPLAMAAARSFNATQALFDPDVDRDFTAAS
jgi:sugar phosphate isomerase/epimerase